jgi:hypothetical protein
MQRWVDTVLVHEYLSANELQLWVNRTLGERGDLIKGTNIQGILRNIMS